MSDLRFGPGVLRSDLPFATTGASERGGLGGVATSEAESLFGGGVLAVGDSGVMPLASLAGLLARKLLTASELGFLARSLSTS